jgi:HMG (high mobility group) box/LysM domain
MWEGAYSFRLIFVLRCLEGAMHVLTYSFFLNAQTLINFVIEQLECMKGTSKANYDYVVLQATDNSIPFYESMGFVRVGAVMLEADGKPSSRKTDVEESLENPFVTSPIMSYKVSTGETLTRIAAKFEVDVWDIIFLNKHILGDAQPSSKPKLNTLLIIPAKEELDTTASVPSGDIQWHVAKENETPRIIANKFKVNCKDIVDGNKGRLPGLMASSRLKDGTRIKISHFDFPENEYAAYAHWSFPDAKYEEPEPSYMMARKLNRRKGNERNYRPTEASLKAPISSYEPSPLLLPPSPQPVMPPAAFASLPPNPSAKRAPGVPQPPKRPISAYMLFATEQRELARGDGDFMKSGEGARIIRDLWNELPASVKTGYETEAKAAYERYQEEMAKYEARIAAFYASKAELDELESLPKLPMSAGDPAIKASLYNKVVRLKPGATTEGSEYRYWYVVVSQRRVWRLLLEVDSVAHLAAFICCRYVLTFIPDLKWCHLAPMVQDGTFGPDKPKAQGKPKWKLVDESLGKEVDISSSYCIPIKSRSMRKTLDADKEEWDVIDDGTDPTKMPSITPRAVERRDGFYPSATRGITAVKPSVERARKKPFSFADSPSLLATMPGSGMITTVRLVGTNIFEDPSMTTGQKRGRPKGSKNKPKTPETLDAKAISADCRDASKKRRTSAVKFDVPASARKAAALRSSTEQKPKGLPPRALKTAPTESPGGFFEKSVSATGTTPASLGQRKRKAESEKVSVAEDHRPKRYRTVRLELPAELSEDDPDSSFADASSGSSTEDSELVMIEPTRSSPRLCRSAGTSANNRRNSASAAVPPRSPRRPRRSAAPVVKSAPGPAKRDSTKSGQNSETRGNPRRSCRSETLRESPMNVPAPPSRTRKRSAPAAEVESRASPRATGKKVWPKRKSAPFLGEGLR